MRSTWCRPGFAASSTCKQLAPRQLRARQRRCLPADWHPQRPLHHSMDRITTWTGPRTRTLLVVATAAAAAGAMGQPFRPLSLLLHLIRLAAAALAAAIGLPLLLSTAVGARMLAGAAGRALGARVEIDQLSCVWWQPLRVEGVRVYMPSSSSSTSSSGGGSGDVSDGSSWEGANVEPQLQEQQGAGRRRASGRAARRQAAAAAAAAAVPVPSQQQRSEEEEQQHPGLEVLSVERISTAEPLSHLASGRPLTLTLARPCLTLTWDPATGAPRLPGALQLDMSTLPAVTLEPPLSFPPHLRHLRPHREQEESAQGASDTGRHRRWGRKTRERGPSSTTPRSATATTSSSTSQVLKRLQQADGVVGLAAELLLPGAQVYVAEGRLACPSELSAALGESLHLSAAAGPGPVAELGEQLDLEPPHADTSGRSARGRGWPSNTKWPFLMQVAGSHLQGSVAGWWLGGTRLALAQPAEATWTATPQLFRLTMGLFNPLMRNVAVMPQHTTFATRFTPLPAPPGSSSSSSGALLCQLDPMQLQLGPSKLLNELVALLQLSPSSLATQGAPCATTAAADGTLLEPQQQQGGGRWGLLQRVLPRGSSSSSLGGPGGEDAGGGAWAVEAWVGPCEVVVMEGGRLELKRLDMQLSMARCRRPPLVVTLALWGGADVLANTLSLKLGLTAPTLASLGIRGLAPDYVLPLRLQGSCDAPSLVWGDAMRRLAVLSAMQASARGGAGTPGGAVAPAGGQGAAVAVSGGEESEAGVGRGSRGGVLSAAQMLLGKVLGGLNTAAEAQLEEVPPPIVSVLPWQEDQ